MTTPPNKPQWPIVLYVTVKPLSERHAVTGAVFGLAIGMLLMAREDPKLWEIELFKIILQAVIISGIFGSIVAFHFSANKGDEAKSENTAKAFEAIKAAATGSVSADASTAANQVADAAADEAAIIEGETRNER